MASIEELAPPSPEQCVMKRQEYFEDIPPKNTCVMRRQDYHGILEEENIFNNLEFHSEVTGKYKCNKEQFIKLFYDCYSYNLIHSLEDDFVCEIIIRKPHHYTGTKKNKNFEEMIWSIQSDFHSKEFENIYYKQYHPTSLFSNIIKNM